MTDSVQTSQGRKLFLVWGDPEQGKTTLSKKLEQTYGYHRISVDNEYVKFIRTAYPDLYFEKLHRYIGPHYDYIFNISYTKTDVFQKDVQRQWHDHLLQTIRPALAEADRVAGEGYLLEDCREPFARELRERDNVKVLQVEAGRHRYYITEAGRRRVPMTVEQLVAEMDS